MADCRSALNFSRMKGEFIQFLSSREGCLAPNRYVYSLEDAVETAVGRRPLRPRRSVQSVFEFADIFRPTIFHEVVDEFRRKTLHPAAATLAKLSDEMHHQIIDVFPGAPAGGVNQY